MKSRRLSNDKLKVIRNYLPQGSNNIIAKITGLSPVQVSKVLHGVHLNPQVIEEALKIAIEDKALSEALEMKYNDLVNNQSHGTSKI
jgi:hypothetical protein